MVELVGHALLLCCICLDVDNISDTVRNQKSREFDGTMIYPRKSSSALLPHHKAQSEDAPLKPLLNIWRVRAL